MSRLRTLGVILLLFFGPGTPGWAAEPDPELTLALQTLKEAGIGNDAVSLLNFFRKRTLSEQDQKRLAATVRALGDESYLVREAATQSLKAAGRSALPLLRAAATDPDPEIVARVLECLDEVDVSRTLVLVSAAVRVLLDRNPPESTSVLLGYLPYAKAEFDEEDTTEALFFPALLRVSINQGKPVAALKEALTGRQAICRAAAAYVLGRNENPPERLALVPLLADPDPRVRYEAGSALAGWGDRKAVVVLMKLLTEGTPELACMTEELLARLPKSGSPVVCLGGATPAERLRCRNEWEAWWKDNEAKVDLASLKQEIQDLTLVCEFDGRAGGTGRVAALTRDNKPRWEIAGLNGPNDAQVLPGGRILVAERNGSQVTERDRTGAICWKYDCASPIGCQRLPGGNTLITTFSEIKEVTREGKVVFSYSHHSGFRQATRLRNNVILFVTGNGEIGELSQDRKLGRLITPKSFGSGASYWATVETLPGGRFLAVYGGANKIVELDPKGSIVWECTQPAPVFATRLRNGNTLIACFEGKTLVEVNREGKEVAKTTLAGRPFLARRY